MEYSEEMQTQTVKKLNALLPWIVCFFASLFFFYEFIQMNMFNAISSSLMNEFKLTASKLSTLSAIYFYSNVLFLLPAGMILDRVSTRKVILIALAICVVGTFLFSISTSVWMLATCRFFTAIGSAFCFLSCIRLASRWFPAHRLALVAGLVVTMAMTGGMVAQAPLVFLVAHLGWRHALMLDAGLGLIILGLIFCTVQNYPAHYQKTYEHERQQLANVGYWKSMCLSFLHLQNWLCGIYTSLLNLPIFIMGGLWGILYLTTVKNIPQTHASFITSMLFLGTIIGSPVAGWFSDLVGRRRAPMIGGAIISLAVMLTIMFAPQLSYVQLLLLFLLLGFVTSTQVISYPTVAESNTTLLTATSVSVVSICAISGGAIFQPIFGWLMDLHWQGAMSHGVRVYSAGDYQFAISILPIAFIVGLIAALLLRETFCKRSDKANRVLPH